MPAIVLARLRQQAHLLAGHFTEPAAFVRSMHHLLDYYADRTHRPGRAGVPAPLLPAYNVPPPVLRQILAELAPLAEANPPAALSLCDALWAEETLEYRQLAASLLGSIPLSAAREILQRVNAWAWESFSQERMLTSILTHGLVRLRQEDPQQVLELAENWLEDSSLDYQKLGLRALQPLLSTSLSDNLPIFFRLINPFVRVAPSRLRPDILDILGTLARRSPKETAHYLRQNLDIGKDTAWLIRQTLDEFPADIQENLRATVRTAEIRK